MVLKSYKYIKDKLIYKFKKKVKFKIKKFYANFLNNWGNNFVESKYGIKFKKNWIDSTFRIYINASYGYFFWDFLTSISKKFIFIDIGSNQGLYSICAAKNNFCSKVYSFEPVYSTFLYLRENISINNMSDKCYLINKGIGNKAGNLDIFINEAHSGVATIREKDIDEDYQKKEKIELIDHNILNSLIKNEKKLDIIVKVDVEGYEEKVFETLIKTNFFKKIKNIFYEIDERWVNPEILKDILKKEGFTEFSQIGKGRHYDVLAKK